MVHRFVSKLAVSALALWVARYFLDGFDVIGGWKGYLLAGSLLALLNIFVRPILKFLSFPLILATLGLFTLVINGALLWFTDHVLGALIIADTATLIIATLITTAVHMLLDAKQS